MIPRNNPVIEHERHMMSGHESATHGTDHMSDLFSGVFRDKWVVNSGNWTNPATWSGGTLPAAGQKIHIPTGKSLIYNQHSNVEYSWVRVDGSLKFSTSMATRLCCDTLFTTCGSYLEIGNIQTPATAEIIWNSGALLDPGHQMSRGLITMGRVMIVGRELVPFAKLPDSMPAGTTTFTLPDTRDPLTDAVVWTGAQIAASWQVGDQLYFPRNHSTSSGNDLRTIASISGASITLSAGTSFRHNGAGGDPQGVGAGNRIDPTGLIHRHQSYVVNETRSIVFRSKNQLPVLERGHMMIGHGRRILNTDKHLRKEDHRFVPTLAQMGPNADPGVYLSGFSCIDMGRTETKGGPKIGQPGNQVGRYPLHLHRTGHWAQHPVVTRLVQIIGNVGWALVRHDCHASVDLSAARGENGEGFNGGGALFMDEEDTEFGAWTRCIGYNCQGRTDTPVQGTTDFNNEGSFNGHGHFGDAFTINRNASFRWLIGIDVKNIVHIHPPKTNTRRNALSTLTTGYPTDRKPDWEGLKRTSFIASPVAAMWRDDPNPGGWLAIEGMNFGVALRVFHRQRAYNALDYHTIIQGCTLTEAITKTFWLENYIINYLLIGNSCIRPNVSGISSQVMQYGDKSHGLVMVKNRFEGYTASLIGIFGTLANAKNLAGGLADNELVNTGAPPTNTGADFTNYDSSGWGSYTFGVTWTNAPYGGQTDQIEPWITDGFTGRIGTYKADYTPPVAFDRMGPRPGGLALRGTTDWNIHIPVNRAGFDPDNQLSLSDRELVMVHGCVAKTGGHYVPLYFPYRDRLTANLQHFRTEYDVTHLPLAFRQRYLIPADPGAPSTANIIPAYPARKTATSYACHPHPTQPIHFVITDGVVHVDAVEAYLTLPLGQSVTETVNFALADGSTRSVTFTVQGKGHAPTARYVLPEVTRGGDFVSSQGRGVDEYFPSLIYLGKGKTNGWPHPWANAVVKQSTDNKATWPDHPDEIGIHDHLFTSPSTWTNSGGRRGDGPFNVGVGHYRMEVTYTNSFGSLTIPSNTLQVVSGSGESVTYGEVWDVTKPTVTAEP